MHIRTFLMAMALVVIVSIGGSETNAQVHGTVAFETHVKHEKAQPVVEVDAGGSLKGKKLGWEASAEFSRDESEALAGLNYSPKKGLKFSASAGLETHKHHLGAAGRFSLEMEKDKWLIFHRSQAGKLGYKTKNLVRREIGSFAVGVYGKTDFGGGPYAEKNFQEKFILWGAMGFGSDAPKGVIGIKYHF